VVTRYIGGRPLSTEEAWTKFLRYIGHWSVMGFGFWAIEEKDSGRFIGELGFADFKRDITPSLGDTLELGWVLASRAHGRGYATEALQAVVAWGKGHLKAERTVCLINPENLASIRVAKKCGFQEFSRAAYKGAPTIIFEHQAKAIPG
jgi:RimJ/RimL family protein N-acetyltransferase